MPGLRYQAPAAAINSNCVSSPFHSDAHLPAAAGGGFSWESNVAADFRSVQQQMTPPPAIVIGDLPYLSHRHNKAAAAAAGGPLRRPSSLQQQLPAAAARMPRGSRPEFLPQSTKQLLVDGGSVAAMTSSFIGSSESDDLAAMVHDFIENDSGDLFDHSDSDCGGGSPSLKRSESLQSFTAVHGALERELLTDVKRIVLTINEDTDLICNSRGGGGGGAGGSKEEECKGGCTKRFVVKHLKALGYNAAVCNSRWQSSVGGVPGGEYQYIDVVFDGEESRDEEYADRYIVDLDFQAQFEIARPTPQYEAALKSLPTVFVGTSTKLKQVLEIMSNAAKVSLKQNAMHLPPWRTLDYMSAKWFSNFERKKSHDGDVLLSVSFKEEEEEEEEPPSSRRLLLLRQSDARVLVFPLETKLCGEQLWRTKVSLLGEAKGSQSALCNLPRVRSGRTNLMFKRSIL